VGDNAPTAHALMDDERLASHPPQRAKRAADGTTQASIPRCRCTLPPSAHFGPAKLGPGQGQCEGIPHGSPSCAARLGGWVNRRGLDRTAPGPTLPAAGSIRVSGHLRQGRTNGDDGGASRVAIHRSLKLG
jgi:hypothetical protein